MGHPDEMENLEQYKVIADYERKDSHQVTLRAGQIVHVIEKHDTGGWALIIMECTFPACEFGCVQCSCLMCPFQTCLINQLCIVVCVFCVLCVYVWVSSEVKTKHFKSNVCL